MASFCGYGNDTSGYIKGKQFLGQVTLLLKKDYAS
jgi:hypothetical protein